MGCEVQAAGVQRGFDLGQPIAAVAIVFEHRREVGQIIAVDVGVGGVLLVEGQVGGLGAEVAATDELDRDFAGAMEVEAGLEALDGIDDQVAIV